jgi:hypothetical protein
MRKLIAAGALCLGSASWAQSPPTLVEIDIGKGVGKLRFELVKIGTEPYERWKQVAAEIRISSAGSSKLLQTIDTQIGIPGPQFDFADLNGDGYKDLLFYNDCAGFATCAGPTIGADVFLYIPRLGNFVKSQTLSGLGEVGAASKKGCAVVSFKSGPAGYTSQEWCFNQKTGRWRLVKSSGEEPTND